MNPVSTKRCFNVYLTYMKFIRRWNDVQITSRVDRAFASTQRCFNVHNVQKALKRRLKNALCWHDFCKHTTLFQHPSDVHDLRKTLNWSLNNVMLTGKLCVLFNFLVIQVFVPFYSEVRQSTMILNEFKHNVIISSWHFLASYIVNLFSWKGLKWIKLQWRII